MQPTLDCILPILERTPAVVRTLLEDLPENWTHQNEGPETWSPFDIVGHLIHGEQTDWIPRTKIILSNRIDKTFEPFDRFAQFEKSEGKSMPDLLEEFDHLRAVNIKELKSLNITDEQLKLTGIHPELGSVNLRQLLSTWATHDLSHVSQIARVMAKQHKDSVGPWMAYLGILDK